jgi:phosphatidate cytidylyltransferase
VLRTRLLTAAVALPAVLAAIIFLPAWAFTLFIVVLGLWGLYEVAEMTRPGSRGLLLECLLIGIVFGLHAFLKDRARFWWAPPLAATVVMLALVVEVGRDGADGALARWNAWGFSLLDANGSLAAIGAVYVGAVFPYFALLRNCAHGIELVILMLLLVICTDSGAYFTGRAIGRHKLAVRVSPGKTIEGAVGGIAAAIIAGLLLRGWLVPQWNIVAMAGFASIIAVLAVVGDLANSAFKRVAGVKDSGWIFPGHGGLLDRTCSLVLAAVLTYYYSA